jgi:hypothetical protein
MGMKSSKRRKPGRAIAEAQEAAPRYPFDGILNDEKLILSLMDRLFQSHAELCTALRLAGRRLLRVEEQNSESLQKIRKVLKCAENVRKALMLNEWTERLENRHKSVVALADEYNRNHVSGEGPIGQSVQEENSPSRRHSQGVIRFPSA